ncbi:MAG: four helix bundle protein [Bacteroidetes bacterium]|nr:MAG: four helix bundle protein [Bacteroidota bacterium]
MATINSFEDLKVWQAARALNSRLYDILNEEDDKHSGFLINHIFKTGGSVMDNIAEGFERDGSREFKQFLSFSKGSIGELRSQLYRALDRGILSEFEFDELHSACQSLGRQCGSFMNYLKTTDIKGNKFTEPFEDY